MTKELTSFSEAEDEFYDIVCDVKGLMTIATVLHKTESPEIPKAINKLTRKLQNQKDRLLEIKTFTDNIDHDHPCYDVDMTEALGTIKNQLSWLDIVKDIYYKTHVYDLDNKKENPMRLTQIIDYLKRDHHNIVDLFFEKIQTYKDEDKSSKALQSAYYQSLKTDQERQVYAAVIGQQYALDLLCSSISEILRMYDLEHLNTFFKTVELVIA